jgi:hypothetical protein
MGPHPTRALSVELPPNGSASVPIGRELPDFGIADRLGDGTMREVYLGGEMAEWLKAAVC